MDGESILATIEQRTSQELKSIFIPEWKGTIYCRPMTLDQQDKIISLARKRAGKDDKGKQLNPSNSDILTYAIITCALNESGEKIFTAEHRDILKSKEDWRVISRVGNFIQLGVDLGSGAQEITIEEAEEELQEEEEGN